MGRRDRRCRHGWYVDDGPCPRCIAEQREAPLGPLFDPAPVEASQDGVEDGNARRREAMALLEEHHGDKIQASRWAMRRLFLTRQRDLEPHLAWVTADDVRDFLDLLGSPPQEDTHWLGAIWNEKGWVKVGIAASRRPLVRARRVYQWTWRPA